MLINSGSSLPFALVETTGWLAIVIVAFISYGILGVVANAAELEDPFGSGKLKTHLTHSSTVNRIRHRISLT